jgi:prephenate dehydrogenase
LGLMGGSLALALKERAICREVIALVRREAAVREALTLGVVDQATTDPAQGLGQADLVIFTTPVRVILRQLVEFVPFYKPGAILTDMGSTKQKVMQVMATLPKTVYPLGSHPMCGKEQAGLAVAEANLYENAPWIITTLPDTLSLVVQQVVQLAEAVGAKPRLLAADRHDRLVAAISHLPYTLAMALVLTAQEVAESDGVVWDVAASGFRDTSRVAASDVTMMLDILLTNRAALGDMLAIARRQLDRLTQALDSQDETLLRAMMEQSAAQRKVLYQ